MATCPNCLAESGGEYCAACGQQRLHDDDLSATRFLRDIADQAVNLRFNFKILRSLAALATPGRLPVEFLSGRRGGYLNPLRLYLVCAAIFFVAAPWAGFTLEQMIDNDRSGALAQLASAQMAVKTMTRAHFAERFDLRVQTVYTIALGAGVVAIALLLQLISRGRGTVFGAHLVFALYFVSFEYLVTTLIGASRQAGAPPAAAAAAGLGAIAVYLVLALQRVYGGAPALSTVRAIALFLLTLGINYAASAASIRVTLLLV